MARKYMGRGKSFGMKKLWGEENIMAQNDYGEGK
jgi:hypothetical protein